jgi:predicted DNA-binding protein
METKKKTKPIMFRLSREQKEKLLELADNGGYNTLSSYIRDRILNTPDLELHHKLNRILEEVRDLKNG